MKAEVIGDGSIKVDGKDLGEVLTVISEHLAKLEQRVEGIVREMKRSGALNPEPGEYSTS